MAVGEVDEKHLFIKRISKAAIIDDDGDTYYECPRCFKAFTEPQYVVKHVQHRHAESIQEVLLCFQEE